MGKNLRQRLRRSGRGMVTKKILSDGTISVWGTQIEIYFLHCYPEFTHLHVHKFRSGGPKLRKSQVGINEPASLDSILLFVIRRKK